MNEKKEKDIKIVLEDMRYQAKRLFDACMEAENMGYDISLPRLYFLSRELDKIITNIQSANFEEGMESSRAAK
ncbi:MAG: hypothetical protein KGJ89_05430 [Patescibacteria group bacterium]|nr:hypothetical protein [Patescibacteria group bacterium]MDE2227363.1 hypothetical protein [Patescibacteria group bacterium]